jgi:hypothetical protein
VKRDKYGSQVVQLSAINSPRRSWESNKESFAIQIQRDALFPTRRVIPTKKNDALETFAAVQSLRAAMQ